jgi:N-acetylglucosamine kinase-like BadF-type ATPase
MLGKKEIYIGIYSSAYETIARAEERSGNLIGTASLSESININISIKHSWKIIKTITSSLLKNMDISLNDGCAEMHVGLGIKNTELAEACIELKKQNNLFKTFIVAADGYVLLRGAHEDEGAIIVLDDGVVGNAIKSNKLIKIGGWGFPHADVGSMPWIGLEAIKLTIQWLDGFIDNSPLLTEIYRYFDNDISKLVKWAMCSRTDPKEYSFICNIVLDYLYKSDPHSLSLINRTVSEANKLYEKILEKSDVSSMPCTLHGQLVPHLKKFINGTISKNLINPLGDGAQGALTLVKNPINEKVDNFIITSRQRPVIKPAFTG